MFLPIRLHTPLANYSGWWLFLALWLVLIVLAWVYVLYVLINRFYGYRVYQNALANYCPQKIRRFLLASDEWLKASIMFALILTVAGVILGLTIMYGIRCG